jgi:hypothetical protein
MHALMGGAPLGGAAALPLAAAARRRRAPACRRAASSAPLTRAAQGDVLLEVRDLHAKVAGTDKQILNGLSLTIREGEVHAIMGKNGSGKSTLSKVLVGHPAYEVTAGSVQFKGQDLLALEPEARAHQGLFLSFQSPVEIPGVRRVPRALALRARGSARRSCVRVDPRCVHACQSCALRAQRCGTAAHNPRQGPPSLTLTHSRARTPRAQQHGLPAPRVQRAAQGARHAGAGPARVLRLSVSQGTLALGIWRAVVVCFLATRACADMCLRFSAPPAGGAEDGHALPDAQRERGLLRRREEAQRDPAGAHARTHARARTCTHTPSHRPSLSRALSRTCASFLTLVNANTH